MSDFLIVIANKRRLRAAIKELEVDKLEMIAEVCSDVALAKTKALEERQEKINSLILQMKDAGLTPEDLMVDINVKQKPRYKTQLPAKYKFVDEDGKEHFWSGHGRRPKFYINALEKGISEQDMLIT